MLNMLGHIKGAACCLNNKRATHVEWKTRGFAHRLTNGIQFARYQTLRLAEARFTFVLFSGSQTRGFQYLRVKMKLKKRR
jgi:hypothetical protein